MMLVALLIGIALPSLVGWLALDLLQGSTRVLLRGEQWVLGFVLGTTLSLFCAFVGNVMLAVPFTLLGFLGVFAVMLIALGVPWLLKKHPARAAPALRVNSKISRPMLVMLIALGAWVLLRVATFTALSLTTPSFFDDSMDNWNMRGKVFYVDQTLTLILPHDTNAQGVSSYPPTVPLSKTWLATLNGSWSEALANGIHSVWFIALLLLVYWSLRRMVPAAWALLGVLVLASLPLELIQGTNAYADVFVSLHILAAASMLLHALRARDGRHAGAFIHVSACALALLPFTKNEGWALYFPVLLLLSILSVLWLWKKRVITARGLLTMAALAGAMILLIAGTWIGFKVAMGLSFGNAKSIDLNFQWQPGVILSVTVNTFFEGNWGLLFPLFFGLLIARWRTAFRSPLLVLTALFLIPYVGQMTAYMFTGLSQEALFQTGYARGLIHLMPVVVMLTLLLSYDLLFGLKMSDETLG